MATPRKFSEKIALQKQKQDECSAEFDKIMKEVNEACNIGTAAGQIGGNRSVAAASGVLGNGSGGGGTTSPEANSGGSPTGYRESRNRSVGVGPMRRPSERKQDRSPYGSNSNSGTSANLNSSSNMEQKILYLSPPMDNSWRRSNSDSALHQSLANENAFGLIVDHQSLHGNYQHNSQRSQSPNIGRHLSPQAQRRKDVNLMHQQQHHSQQQMLQLHQRNQMHNQQSPMNHLHMQQQQQLQHQQFQMQHNANMMHQGVQHQQLQQDQNNVNFISKLNSCGQATNNNLFKSLQDQTHIFANTGSLPDLTSVHFASSTPQQQQQQQQQQTLSSTLNNESHERNQPPSPFNAICSSGYMQQQQQSPTHAVGVTSEQQSATTSPQMTYKNLRSPADSGAHSIVSFSPLPTLGANSSHRNLTNYRQPLNPPSPGSSPGLLTSSTGNELHTSAPESPIHAPAAPTNLQHPNMPGFDRYSPSLGTANIDAASGGNNGGGYNSLYPSFHNHFEQFSLGDSNSSPEPQHHMQQSFQQNTDNNFVGLNFDELREQQNQNSNFINKLLELNGMQDESCDASSPLNAGSNNNNHSTQNHMLMDHQQQQQQIANNNNRNCEGHNALSNSVQAANNNANAKQVGNSSGICSPVLPSTSPSSPLPIPIGSPHSPSHQLSLSMHSQSVQHSPHHSPLNSPHHQSAQLSTSSPGISAFSGYMSPANVSGTHTPINGGDIATHKHHMNTHCNNSTTPSIPSIVFSDCSSTLFDSIDLDLAQLDVGGLHMLSDDASSIIISDPGSEDIRRDLN